MNDTPEISVIIPAYNAESTVDMCVRSLINQTYKNLDIILIDDCSTDSTPALCDRLASQYGNVRTVHLKKNSGPSEARNAGIEIANGEWLAFVDSDDWVEPETYKTAIEYAQSHAAKHIIWSYVSEYNQVLKEKHIYSSDVIFKGENANDIFYDTLGPTGERLAHPEFIHSLSTVCCKLFSSEIIKKNNLRFYNLEKIVAEDLHFSAQYINCISGETSVYIDKCYYHYIKANQGSLSTKHKPDYTQMVKTINRELETMVKNRPDKEKCMEALENRRALALINIGLNEVAATHGMRKTVKRLHSVLCDEKFSTAFRKLEFCYLPLKWKVFFGAARFRLSFAVYVLLKIMTILVARKD
jgi:glycosyltransferase EpsH